MRTLKLALLAALMSALLPYAAAAQQSDEQAVRAVVDRLFDGMRARDTLMMKSVFHPDAQLWGVGQNGSIGATPIGQFIASIARAPAGLLLDEVLHDVEVRVDGSLASVWTYYDFFAGDRFSHCGYDAVQLLRTGGEWKIVSIADSRRTESCRQQRR